MELEDVRKSLVKVLADLFGLKIPNPVVDFWFCGKVAMEDGTAEKPADFDQYTLIDEKTDKDGITWLCYGRKATSAIISRRYWLQMWKK